MENWLINWLMLGAACLIEFIFLFLFWESEHQESHTHENRDLDRF